MTLQLPSDCLNEIFEYLEDEKPTLHSCLLVNRLWCVVSVRILWKIIWNFDTLIACLPIESKEILFKNGIIISIQNSKYPLFNYIEFIKNLSINEIDEMIEKKLLNKHQIITSPTFNHVVVAQ